jgi:hypothetical protein
MACIGHVALTYKYLNLINFGERGAACGTWGRQERCMRQNTWKTGIDGRIILKRVFKKWDGEVWVGLLWLRIGRRGGRL